MALEVERLKKECLAWNLCELQCSSQPHSKVNGKNVLMMCTNNYLGLATHPKMIEAMCTATKKWGVGAGAVPVLSGKNSLQYEFEKKFAEFKGVEASLLCQTGFAVNSGLIPQLAGEGDIIISDQLNHGSIIDGVRLSKAEKAVYKHCDVADLERVLTEAEEKKFKTLTYIDDCHGEGVLGNGKGAVAHFNLQGKINIEGGSLGKAFGVFGGTIAGSRALKIGRASCRERV